MIRLVGIVFFLFGAALMYFTYLDIVDNGTLGWLGYLVGGLFLLLGGWMAFHRKSRPAMA
ncbi:MAG TPA: hypothetical protein VJH92_00065 [Candidatus Nanoarchaeia archaeon]|nr:hypothetical protein [Candidatus Nanoarchaeia archaeon]